jgi:hypothetical protein
VSDIAIFRSPTRFCFADLPGQSPTRAPAGVDASDLGVILFELWTRRVLYANQGLSTPQQLAAMLRVGGALSREVEKTVFESKGRFLYESITAELDQEVENLGYQSARVSRCQAMGERALHPDALS